MPEHLHCTSEEDVAQLGRKLQIALPRAYRDVLIRYPFPLDDDLARVVLYEDPKKIVAQNEYYRTAGFFGHSWPLHYLIIGDFMNGDLVFLDTALARAPVFIANHELSSGKADLAVEDVGSTLSEWVIKLLALSQE